jgi:hypothetical protein
MFLTLSILSPSPIASRLFASVERSFLSQFLSSRLKKSHSMFRSSDENLTFTCLTVYPGIECNLPEQVVLGVLCWIAVIVGVYFLVAQCKNNRRTFFHYQSIAFWSLLAIWQLFYGLICIVSFGWTASSYRYYSELMNNILLFVPLFLVTLMTLDLYFLFRNPGQKTVAFFRRLFLFDLALFVGLGITLSLSDPARALTSTDKTIALWSACTYFMLAVSYFATTRAFLQAVTKSIIQSDANVFVNIGVYAEVALFLGNCVWKETFYFDVNVVEQWFAEHPSVINDGIPQLSGSVRAVHWIHDFFLDVIPAALAMITGALIMKHDSLFTDNPYFYTSEMGETSTNDHKRGSHAM